MAEATQLKSRHLTMMGLGSAVGAGLFLGVGLGIQISGTSVLISYAVAGVLIALIMWMLGEIAAARPSLGSFSTYAGQAFGHWARFTMGWIYWFMLIMVMGAEITGAAAIIGSWFDIAPWIPALMAPEGSPRSAKSPCNHSGWSFCKWPSPLNSVDTSSPS